MGKFLAILLGAADELDEAQISQERQMEFMTAWGEWAQKAGSNLVDPGHPLYRKKRVSAEGVVDFEDDRVSYCIVEADTHEAAVELLADHPHLGLHPGNAIEVLECPPVPTV